MNIDSMDYIDQVILVSPFLLIGTILLTIYYIIGINKKFPKEKRMLVYVNAAKEIVWPVLVYMVVIFAFIGPRMQAKSGFNYIYIVLIFLAWLLVGNLIFLVCNCLLKNKNNKFFIKEGISVEERKKINIFKRPLSLYTVFAGVLSIGYSVLLCGTTLSLIYILL